MVTADYHYPDWGYLVDFFRSGVEIEPTISNLKPQPGAYTTLINHLTKSLFQLKMPIFKMPYKTSKEWPFSTVFISSSNLMAQLCKFKSTNTESSIAITGCSIDIVIVDAHSILF